jgi:hypothetical protein
MILRHRPGIDPNDGVALRTYLESLRSWLSNERSSWDTQYVDLARFFLPRSPRFNYNDVDQGYRKDYSIVDNTGTQAINVCAAGIFSAVSSPVRTWFHIKMADEKLMDLPEVKEWIDEAEDRLRAILIKSNFYQTILRSYQEEILYGTTAFLIAEDAEDVIRCHPYPVGSYYISGDDSLRVDFCMRIVNMTNRQLVDRFGYAHVSDSMKSYYDSNAGGLKEQWWPVVHVISRNSYYDYTLESKQKPWRSVYYEMNSFNAKQGLLSQSGFDEFPVMVGRWDVTGENFYGNSPAMNALGDQMALQLMQKRKSQAIDKMVNPPMVGSPMLANQKISILPGEVTFADMRDGSPGLKAAYQIDFHIDHVMQDIAEHQKRINAALYKDMFLLNTESDRRMVTAEEIRARQEEKMLVLGPVAERTNDEILEPALQRVMAIAMRKGLMPPLPPTMRGKTWKLEFESILAQAQRLFRTANIDRLAAFLGTEVALNQGVLDIFDLDMMAKDYAKLLGVPPNIVRADDQIQAIRSSRAEQAAKQQNADNALKLAQAGKNLAQADVGSDNALTRLMPQLGQPAGA